MRGKRKEDLRSVRKGVNKSVCENVPRWFGHVRKMAKNKLVKRIYW